MSAKQTKTFAKIQIKILARKEAENLISSNKHKFEQSIEHHIEEHIQEHEDLTQCLNVNIVDSDSFYNTSKESESEQNKFNFETNFNKLNILSLLLNVHTNVMFVIAAV